MALDSVIDINLAASLIRFDDGIFFIVIDQNAFNQVDLT
jgi:hypothetical protein